MNELEYLKKYIHKEDNLEEAIKRLKGIPCGYKGTSCPDQMARGLEEIQKKIG